MTREEELQQFAEQNTKGLHLDRHNLIQMVKAGAEWADQHPQWIPVEEELPPKEEADPNVSVDVIVTDGKSRYTSHYNFSLKMWRWYKNVTHWMPLPAAPRKEDRNDNI